MASRVAEAFIEINAASGNLSEGLDAARGQVTAGVQGIMGSAGAAAMGGIAAIAALGLAVTDYVGKVISGEQAMTLFNFRVEAMGEHTGFAKSELLGMAGAFETYGQVGQMSVRDVMSSLLRFDSVSGDVFRQATQAAIDFSVTGLADAGQAANALGFALTNPAMGMRMLKQLGIAFSHDQAAAITAMTRMGDTAGAQGIIMQQVTRQTQGLGAAMTQTVQGQLNVLKKSIEEIGMSIAKLILPPLAAIVSAANWTFGVLEKGWNSVPSSIKEVVKSVSTLAAGFVAMTVLGPLVATAFSFLAPVGAAIGLLLGPWGVLVVGVGAFAAALAALPDWSKWFDRARASATEVWAVIQQVGYAIADGFTGSLGQSVSAWDWLKTKALEFRDAAIGAVDAVSKWLKDNQDTLRAWGAEIGAIARESWAFVVEIASWAMDTVKYVVKTNFEAVAAIFAWITGENAASWKNIGDNVTSALQWIRALVSEWPLTFQVAWASIKFSIFSAWDAISNYLAAGMTQSVGGWATMWAMVKVLMEGFYTAACEIVDALFEVFKGLWSSIKAGWEAVKSGNFTGIADAMGREMGAAVQRAEDAMVSRGTGGALLARARAAGQAAADEWRAAIDVVRADEGAMTAEARKELERLADLLGAARAGQQNVNLRGRDAGQAPGAPPPPGSQGGESQTTAVEFKTESLTNAWKMMQESSGQKMEAIAQAHLAVGQQQVNNQIEGNRIMGQIFERVGGPGHAG